MKNYNDYLITKKTQFNNFDSSDLNSDFIHAFESGKRVEVNFKDSSGKVYETKRGTIGVTTGWKPCFLLMLTKRSTGSSWTIGKNDVIAKYV